MAGGSPYTDLIYSGAFIFDINSAINEFNWACGSALMLIAGGIGNGDYLSGALMIGLIFPISQAEFLFGSAPCWWMRLR